MKKKLFDNDPQGYIVILCFVIIALACIYTFVATFRLPQSSIVAVDTPLVYLPRPTSTFSTVGQKLGATIDESTPFIAVTNKNGYFSKLVGYKEGLEQNAQRISYDQFSPEQLAIETARLRDSLFPSANATSKTLVILPSPDLNMEKLKLFVFHLRESGRFENVILADGII